MSKNRRRADNQNIVMEVIVTMRWIGYILYGTLGVCLLASIFHGIKSGSYELAIVTALISAVSAGANAAGGFMAGVLSQSFGKHEPLEVTNPPGEALETKPTPSTDEAPTEEIGSEEIKPDIRIKTDPLSKGHTRSNR